ncbi:hypothetical protein CL622_05310 [archaeon]|nr:hypothetical protein [archaeon]|tara:strand:- start:98 stop:5254 length:5157 start_codon:yes stop_codon:yes gene_type:complete
MPKRKKSWIEQQNSLSLVGGSIGLLLVVLLSALFLSDLSLTGFAVVEEQENVSLVIKEAVEDVVIEYETPAPYTVEEEIGSEHTKTKRVTVVSDASIHYENVVAFTELPNVDPSQVRIYWHQVKVDENVTGTNLTNATGNLTESNLTLVNETQINNITNVTVPLPEVLVPGNESVGDNLTIENETLFVNVTPIENITLPPIEILPTNETDQTEEDVNTTDPVESGPIEEPSNTTVPQEADEPTDDGEKQEDEDESGDEETDEVEDEQDEEDDEESEEVEEEEADEEEIEESEDEAEEEDQEVATTQEEPILISTPVPETITTAAVKSVTQDDLFSWFLDNVWSIDTGITGQVTTELTPQQEVIQNPSEEIIDKLITNESSTGSTTETVIEKVGNQTDQIERIDITEKAVFIDLNNDGLADALYWVVPQLSNQTYDVEISLEILTVQSYPTVGGNWTVTFNTTGKADLTIIGVNDTTYTEVDQDSGATVDDLTFLELQCGNQTLNYSYVLTNESHITQAQAVDQSYAVKGVTYANYSCSDLGSEISLVHTVGVHELQFTFGNQTAYAYNDASSVPTQAIPELGARFREPLIDYFHGDGLVGLWEFERNATDYSGLGNDGTPTGSVTNTTQGRIGNAYTFDDTDGYVDSGRDSSLDFGTEDFTISSWIKINPNQGGISRQIVTKGSRGAGGKYYGLFVEVSGQIKLELDDDTSLTGVLGNTIIENNTWYHVVAVADRSGDGTVYLNGVVDNTGDITSASQTIDDTDKDLVIGASSTDESSGFFNGTIDHVAIWNRSLSSDEIHDLYSFHNRTFSNQDVTVSPQELNDTDGDVIVSSFKWYNQSALIAKSVDPNDPDLVGYWPFDDGNTSDFSQQTNFGTINNDGPKCNHEGKMLGGCYFNGTIGYIESAYDDSLNWTSMGGEFTWSVWMKVRTPKQYQLVRQQNYMFGSNLVGGDCSGVSQVGFRVESDGCVAYTDTVENDRWYHLVAVVNTSSIYLYRDGLIDVMNISLNSTGTNNGRSSSARLDIGGQGFGGGHQALDGWMDDVTLWNRTISSDEIEQLYRAGRSGGFILNQEYTEQSANITVESTVCDADVCSASLNSSVGISVINELNISFDTLTPLNNTYLSSPTLYFNWTTLGTELDTFVVNVYNETDLVNETNVANTIREFNISLNDGTYQYNVSINDTAGKVVVTDFRNVTIDNSTPTISFASETPANNSYVAGPTLYFNWTITENNINTIRVTVLNETDVYNFTEYQNLRKEEFNITLPEGTYQFNVSINDTSGSTAVTDLRNVTVDQTVPDIVFENQTPSNNTRSNESWLYINWTITENNIDTITVVVINNTDVVNHTEYTNLTLDYNTSLVGDATVYFNVSINDTAGNRNTTLLRTYIFDTSAPNVTFTQPTAGNGTVTSNLSLELNASITDNSDLDEFTLNWNGTNYTFYDDSLVLMLNFENVSALGESYNSSNGTLIKDLSLQKNNATLFVGEDASGNFTEGKYGSAFTLDGQDDYINVTEQGNLNLTSFSIEFWFRPQVDYNISSPNASIVVHSDYDVILVNGSMRLKYKEDATSSVRTNWTKNEWYHILATFDGASSVVYINGIEDARTISTAFLFQNSTGDNLASFSASGNISLVGSCFTGSCDLPSDNASLVFQDSSGETIAYVNSTGDFCIEDSDCSFHDTSCSDPTDGSFIIRDVTSTIASYINNTGGLCLLGTLQENDTP